MPLRIYVVYNERLIQSSFFFMIGMTRGGSSVRVYFLVQFMLLFMLFK